MNKKSSSFFQEDWLAVWVGLLSIVLILLGVRSQSPLFLGLACLVLSAIGIAFMGGKIAGYMLGFPVVFALAWLAQTIATRPQVSAGASRNEKTNEAAMKPKINFGKRSQMTRAVGRSALPSAW